MHLFSSVLCVFLDSEDGPDGHCSVQPCVHQAKVTLTPLILLFIPCFQDPVPHPPRHYIPWPAVLRDHVAGLHLHRGVVGPALCLLQQHALWCGLAARHHLYRKVGRTVCKNIYSVISCQFDECHLQFHWNIFQCQEQASYNLVKGRGNGK